MSYDLVFALALGTGQSGLIDLRAQLYDEDGATVGGEVSAGFFAHGTGNYQWLGSIPDGHRGSVRFYRSGSVSSPLAVAAINPEEAELVIEAAGASATPEEIVAALAAAGYTVVDTDRVTATAISKRRGDVWTITLTDLGALGTWTKLWFTIKTGDTGDADTDAKVQILLTNPSVGTDGLQRLNGAAGTAAQGGIVVDDSATGDITVTVASAATTQLAVRSDYVFDVQILRAAGATTLAYGTFTVRSDVTRAVS